MANLPKRLITIQLAQWLSSQRSDIGRSRIIYLLLCDQLYRYALSKQNLPDCSHMDWRTSLSIYWLYAKDFLVELFCSISQCLSCRSILICCWEMLLNQTARGYSALNDGVRFGPRAPVFRNLDIIESSLPRNQDPNGQNYLKDNQINPVNPFRKTRKPGEGSRPLRFEGRGTYSPLRSRCINATQMTKVVLSSNMSGSFILRPEV
jgi:hypothetical protein